jgi:hypothetical protein
VTEISGGDVERINYQNAHAVVGGLFNKKTIATNVEVKVHIHKALEFRNEDAANVSQDKQTLTRKLRNVETDTEFTFEYRIKSLNELVKMDDVDLMKLSSFPF